VGAGLPGLVAACFGLLTLVRRRRQGTEASPRDRSRFFVQEGRARWRLSFWARETSTSVAKSETAIRFIRQWRSSVEHGPKTELQDIVCHRAGSIENPSCSRALTCKNSAGAERKGCGFAEKRAETAERAQRTLIINAEHKLQDASRASASSVAC
jgi:hypothetical protein